MTVGRYPILLLLDMSHAAFLLAVDTVLVPVPIELLLVVKVSQWEPPTAAELAAEEAEDRDGGPSTSRQEEEVPVETLSSDDEDKDEDSDSDEEQVPCLPYPKTNLICKIGRYRYLNTYLRLFTVFRIGTVR